jgi:hypothetical protein
MHWAESAIVSGKKGKRINHEGVVAALKDRLSAAENFATWHGINAW